MSLTAVLLPCLSAPVLAQHADPPALHDRIPSLIERTCRMAPPGQSQADPNRLAAFLLSDAGVLTAHPVRWIDAAVAAERGPDNPTGRPSREQRRVREAVEALQNELELVPGPDGEGLIIDGQRPAVGEYWLFERRLLCVRTAQVAEAPATPDELRRRGLLENGEPILRLRATAKELSATGEDRLAAGSARLAIERERVRLADGGTRRDTTLAIQGALGLALRQSEDESIYLYAAYQLERVRSRPAPELPPGERASDGDTNVLEIGVTGDQLLVLRGAWASLDLSASGALILDRVTRSERVRFDVAVSPGIRLPSLGLCAYGHFATVAPGIGGRCTAALRWQVNQFLDQGPGARDGEFVLGGGEATLEFAPFVDNMLLQSGVFAGLTYRYEASLRGDVPDIDRFTAFLKYRHWFRGRFGIDFGVDFTDGTNPESFVDENRIRVGLGLIF